MWINLERYGLIWVTYESVSKWSVQTLHDFACERCRTWSFDDFDGPFDVRFVSVSSVSVPGVQRGPPQLSPETLGAAAPGDAASDFSQKIWKNCWTALKCFKYGKNCKLLILSITFLSFLSRKKKKLMLFEDSLLMSIAWYECTNYCL